jgi:hypothetical protein
MSAVWDRLAELAEALGSPPEEVVRHHVLEGVLRRLARLQNTADFVLRGSMLTRAWVAPQRRIADDLDFVGTFPHDVEQTKQKFAPALSMAEEDDVCLDPASLRAQPLWAKTAFPGARLMFRAGLGVPDQVIQIDVGFNDPLVPPPYLYDYQTVLPGPSIRLWAVRPETAVAWKLHCLAEMGPHGWRPKDLHDLYLISLATPLDFATLPPAIEAAFLSRGYQVRDAAAVFTSAGWWDLKGARVRWREYRQETEAVTIPEDLRTVVGEVQRRLGAALAALSQGIHLEEPRR